MHATPESAVHELYSRAKLDPTEPCGAPRLAAAVLGERCIQRVKRRALRTDGLLGWCRGWIINIPDGLSRRRVNHAVAHELAEWYLQLCGYNDDDHEELARRIAASLCVPEPAFRAAHRHLGENVTALSRYFIVSESLMALRIAECLGPATALLTGKRIVIRGQPWNWPSTEEGWVDLVSAARGVVLHRLTDVRGRFVLRAG